MKNLLLKVLMILSVLVVSSSFASANDWDIHEDFNVGDQFLMKKSYTSYVVNIFEVTEDYVKAVGIRVKQNGKMYKYEYTFTKNTDQEEGVLYHVEVSENGDRDLPYELLKTDDGILEAGGFSVKTGEFNLYNDEILKKI